MSDHSQLGRLATPVAFVILALMIPIVPFLMFGPQMEDGIMRLVESPQLENRPVWTSLSIAALLAIDILLPVPSTLVCTVSGKLLGSFWGTVASWAGLNLSALIGYWLGSKLGWPMAQRLSSTDSLQEMHGQITRWGIWPLLVFRVFPVLAEASVLLVAVYRMPQRLFWPPVLVANLGIALAFAALGDFSAKHGWFSLALPISLALPAALLLMWLVVWRRKGTETESVASDGVQGRD